MISEVQKSLPASKNGYCVVPSECHSLSFLFGTKIFIVPTLELFYFAGLQNQITKYRGLTWSGKVREPP